MGAFEYRHAQDLHAALSHCGVRYLFLGKSAAILLGFPDTTQDVDVFPRRSLENGQALVKALRDLVLFLTDSQAHEIERGKDFVQLKNGPFGHRPHFCAGRYRRFDTAWNRHVEVEGFPVATRMTSSRARKPPIER
jgi:hypothetical protein